MNSASEHGLRWYQDAKFGMFVHWGLYSLLGRGEWVLFQERATLTGYPALAERFNPERFDAGEWMRIAADAGQEYLTITTRHHDGFSMYHTGLSDYRVTGTPFGRDPLAELAEAGHREGVKLGCYVSVLDWHHPAYRASKRERSKLAWADYVGFLHGQVAELCTNYGPLAEVWFDGDWPQMNVPDGETEWFQAGGDFDYPALYRLIHAKQPDAVVLNNRHAVPLPGEDVQGFEQDLPGANQAGFNVTEGAGGPYETCLTLNGSWGYRADDVAYKSTDELIRLLVRAAAAGSNLLLNVGPTADGVIPAPSAQRLAGIGEWLRTYGYGVKGTRAGRLATPPGVVSTHRDGSDFLHVLGTEPAEEFTVTVPDRGPITVRVPKASRHPAVTTVLA
jgi:alpha-L-fucosidase